jgi:DNA-binding IclR family transcriptional regulator
VVVGTAGAGHISTGVESRAETGAATAAAGDSPEASAALAAEIQRRRATGATVRDVAAALATELNLPRRTVYRLILSLERGADDEGR